ncbi:MAG: GNAT family N-acetyltransferase [Acetobacteraceae bacterium]|nr:GNAT family N-acetyltransferase [Acetobacteraceae bacterium]
MATGSVSICSYAPAHEAAIIEIRNLCAREEGGLFTTVESWRGEMALHRCLPERDLLVAMWGGQPVGYVYRFRLGESDETWLTWGEVLPGFRRRGVGTALMRELIALCRCEGQGGGQAPAPATPLSIGMLSSPRRAGSHELARSLGFWCLSRSLRLERTARGLPQAAWPQGFRFRELVPERDEELYSQLCNRAFADHFPRHDITASDVRTQLASGVVRPGDILLAVADPAAAEGGAGDVTPPGGLVGFCASSFHPQGDREGLPVGDVGRLGIVPEFRRRGLGRALLLESLARLRDRGAARVGLRVIEGNRPAQALYYSLGFAPVESEVIWRLGLGGGEESPQLSPGGPRLGGGRPQGG